jgi:hypothetical protein
MEMPSLRLFGLETINPTCWKSAGDILGTMKPFPTMPIFVKARWYISGLDHRISMEATSSSAFVYIYGVSPSSTMCHRGGAPCRREAMKAATQDEHVRIHAFFE